MPDLFPTTDEAEKDKALELGIVNQLGRDPFKPDGMHPFFEYRHLGLDKLTGGKVGALAARARPGQQPDAPRHTALDFQFIDVLKGRAIFEHEGYGEHMPSDFETRTAR